MRTLNLDFVRQTSSLRRLGVILLIAAVATAAYLAQVYVKHSAELEVWQTKWHRLQKAQRKDATEPASNPSQKLEWEQLQSELKTANRVIARLSLPWDALFREVEIAVGEQVTLLSVEPDTEKSELRITAEAKNLTAMLEYIKRLRAIALFKDAHLTSHQIQQQDPQKPVRFVVNAQWGEAL